MTSKKTPDEFIQERLGTIGDKVSDVTDYTMQDLSSSLKKTALALTPEVFRALFLNAIGMEIFECTYCGEENRVISSKGSFQAQKYWMEQAAEWTTIIKSMNLHVGLDIQVPSEVILSPKQRDSYKLVFREAMNRLGLNPEEVYKICQEVKQDEDEPIKVIGGN